MLARDRQHYHNNQCGHGCECYDSVIKSVMMSLGYKCNPMASRERVPVNFQSSGPAWPQVGVKAVALFDERIGDSDLLSMGVHLHFLLGANNPFGTISSRY